MNVTVIITNKPPEAAGESFTGDKNIAIQGNVLDNDTDPDGDPLEAQLLQGPSNGALTLFSDGSFTYTPVDGFVGEDSFTYKATDGQAESEEVTVFLNIINNAPEAVGESFTGDKNIAIQGNVLDNDTDPDGDPLEAQLLQGPSNGALTLFSDGSFTYTPVDGFVGEDSFTYKATDGQAESEEVTVVLNIVAPLPMINTVDFVYTSSLITADTENVDVLQINLTAEDGSAVSVDFSVPSGEGAWEVDLFDFFDQLPNLEGIYSVSVTGQNSDGVVSDPIVLSRSVEFIAGVDSETVRLYREDLSTEETTYNYDENNNVVSIESISKNINGIRLTRSYLEDSDANGQPEYVVYESYHGGGQLRSKEEIFYDSTTGEQEGSVTREYDLDGNVISEVIEDVAAPKPIGFLLSTDMLDLSGGARSIEIELYVEEELSDVQSSLVRWKSVSGQTVTAFFNDSGQDTSEGYHILTANLLFDENSQNGSWTMDQVFLQDSVGNTTLLYRADIDAMGINQPITISGSSADLEAPTLQDLLILDSGIPVDSENPVNTDSGADLTVRFTLQDNISGIDAVTFAFVHSETGQRMTLVPTFVEKTLEGDVYEKVVSFSEYAANGTWTIDYLFMQDEAGNNIRLTTADLIQKGFTSTFEIEGGTPDIEAPDLESMSFEWITEGEELEITAVVREDVSGIDIALGRWQSRDAGQSKFADFADTGQDTIEGYDIYSATMEFDGLQDKGTWDFYHLFLRDFADNSRFVRDKDVGLDTYDFVL